MIQLPASMLGYCFTSQELLRQALTHPSYLNETRESGLYDYQRLEFLGDAVLGLCLADLLSERFPELHEGGLSRIRASLVDQPRLAELAERESIGPHILLGRGEESDGGREKPSILADILEAVIGAIYKDGGFMTVRAIVGRIYEPLLEMMAEGGAVIDPKSELQERLAAERIPPPVYELLEVYGPPHDRRFRMAVHFGQDRLAEGEGRSKKRAQQEAALSALRLLDQNA